MATLGQIAEARVSAGLGAIIGGWAPDAPLVARLLTGRDAALAVLERHVPDFRYDPAAAREQMSDVDAWAERNGEVLTQIMQSSAEELPEQLRLQMGSERAKAFVIGIFTQAAAGLGPWASGAVARESERGEIINERWARGDAAQRLEAFALIVDLDQRGALDAIFGAEGEGASGLGALPAWIVVVALVVVAAALVTAVVLWRRIDLNNRLLADLCKKAQEQGDTKTIEACIEATKGLQATPFESAASAFSARLATMLVVGAGMYASLRWGLPWASRRLSSGRREPARGRALR